MHLKRGISFAAGAIVATSVVASCLDPTEIDLQISTNVAPSEFTVGAHSATVLIGAPGTFMTNPSTSIPTGAPDAKGNFGDLVIVPSSSSDDTVAIEVALGVNQPTSTCIGANAVTTGCIIATRQLQYVPHHRLVLPIVLDSACLGIQCTSGQTCIAGQCVGNTTDCDSGNCVTGSDGGFDATLDVLDSDCPQMSCNGRCSDVLTDPDNCGACGVACNGTGASCTGGTCKLAGVGGSCVAVYGGSVYVIDTLNTLESVPTQGGLAVPVTKFVVTTAADIQSIGTDMALAGSTTVAWSVNEFYSGKSYSLPVQQQANRVAIDSSGIGWIDLTTGDVWYWKLGGTAALPLYTATAPPSDASIAGSNQIMYVADGSTLCRYSYQVNAACLTATSTFGVINPTAVAVSSPSAAAPTVYDVEAKSIFQFPSLLTGKTTFATGTVPLGAISYDAATSTMYAISTTSVLKAMSGGTLAAVAITASAATRCIAVDDTSVYWVTSTGVFKHVK